MGTHYNANSAPSSSEWLLLAEPERIRLVANYLRTAKVAHASARAPVFVLVENSLARGLGPAKRALERQVAAGASRAEALNVLADCFAHSYVRSREDPGTQEAALVEALNQVAVAQPRSSGT